MAINTRTLSTGTVGSGAVVTVLEVFGGRSRLWLYADSGNSGSIYVRWDGVDPSSSSYSIELAAGAGLLQDRDPPAGEVRILGSASSQRYAIEEG